MDSDVLLDHAKRAFEDASGVTFESVVENAPVLTGDYKSKFVIRLGLSRPGHVARIGSLHAGVAAIEYGAFVGNRRGPHMKRVGNLRNSADAYVDYMTDSLWRIR